MASAKVIIPEGFHFIYGEKPEPTTCRYEDADGVLVTSIAGKTLAAVTSLNDATAVVVTCTNNDDGTYTIDWPTDTSTFSATGMISIRVRVTDTPKVWYMDKFKISVEAV